MEEKKFNSTAYAFSRKPNDKLNSMSSSFVFIPPDPLVQRTIIPLKKAKFGKELDYIELPQFNHPKNDNNLYDFTLTKPDNTTCKDREMPIDIYINNIRRIQKLIYNKDPPDENGKFSFENIVDLTKKKKISNDKQKINETVAKKVDFLSFESRFESGNLELVYLSDDISLDSVNVNNPFLNGNQVILNNNNNNNNNNPSSISPNINNNQNTNNPNNTTVQSPSNNSNNTYNNGNYQNNQNPNNIIYLNAVEEGKKIICHKYLLFLHNDTNTTGYTQWFFFRVEKGKKGEKYTFSILNTLKPKTKYRFGMKIWMYSTQKNKKENVGWYHTKEEVLNYRNNLYRIINGRRKYYATLSFDYTFEYNDDVVFFANCIPYTYTDLMRQLNEYQKQENTKYPYFIRKTLCTTIGGNDLDYITINNMDFHSSQGELYSGGYSGYSYGGNKVNAVFKGINISGSSTQINNNNDSISTGNSSRLYINAATPKSSRAENAPIIIKEGIIFLARIHPSETVGSWVVKGAIDFLLGDSPEAHYLRDNFIFKIIPMMNPDGVISGCTRTSFAGCDLNRRWINPCEELHPEVYATKELIKCFDSQRKVSCIVDFHGHYGAFNSFFYCNRDKDNFSFCKYFPFLCSKISKIIDFDKCKFSMPRYKRGTGRIDLYRELNIENIFTLETSNFGCLSGEYKNKYLNIKLMQQIGVDVCMAILKYHYSSKNKMGIYLMKRYPMIEEKIISELKEIEKKFDTFCIERTEELNKKKMENKDDSNDDNDNDKDNDNDNKTTENNDVNDDDKAEEDDDDSESEPSIDNLDIDKLKSLIPCEKKKKKAKKNKIKKLNSKFYYKKNNNNEQINKPQVSLPQLKNNVIKTNTVSNHKQTESNNINTNKINPLIISSKTTLCSKPIQKKEENNELNSTKKIFIIKVNSYTQTEDIFFKMHWSYFIGTCIILTPKYEYIRDRKNYNSIVSSNRRNVNLDNLISFSNKINYKTKMPVNNYFNTGRHNTPAIQGIMGGKTVVGINGNSANGSIGVRGLIGGSNINNGINNNHSNNINAISNNGNNNIGGNNNENNSNSANNNNKNGSSNSNSNSNNSNVNLYSLSNGNNLNFPNNAPKFVKSPRPTNILGSFNSLSNSISKKLNGQK